MTEIDIRNLDKVKLLFLLWRGSSPARFFDTAPIYPPSFNKEQAESAVKSRIDYFCGRCIKLDLSKDFVDPWLYDRDAGVGAFERIVSTMRIS